MLKSTTTRPPEPLCQCPSTRHHRNPWGLGHASLCCSGSKVVAFKWSHLIELKSAMTKTCKASMKIHKTSALKSSNWTDLNKQGYNDLSKFGVIYTFHFATRMISAAVAIMCREDVKYSCRWPENIYISRPSERKTVSMSSLIQDLRTAVSPSGIIWVFVGVNPSCHSLFKFENDSGFGPMQNLPRRSEMFVNSNEVSFRFLFFFF